MTYQEIKSFINTYIVQNGVNSITGAQLNTALNALADYYGFDSVVVTTLPAGSDATANVQGKTLELGIPKGADGVDGRDGSDGVDGRDGSDAVNPFKGWFNSLDDLKDSYTASVGDSAYVKDASPATTWSIYVYDSTASSDNYWADSGTDADTSNVQTFKSGEEVNETYIDNTHLVNPKTGALPKAEDVMQLKAKLQGVTMEETKATFTVSNGYIRVSDGSAAGGASYKNAKVTGLTGVSYVRFLGIKDIANNGMGFAFYNSSDTPIQKYAFEYDSNLQNIELKEYAIPVPSEASYFKTTIVISGSTVISQSNFYCYKESGETAIQKSDLPTLTNDDGVGDLDISDENNNIIVRFENGHIKTRNFDSSRLDSEVGLSVSDAVGDIDLSIIDEQDNAIMELSGGNIKTRNFSSSEAVSRISELEESGENIEGRVEHLETSSLDAETIIQTTLTRAEAMFAPIGHADVSYTPKRTIKILFIGNSVTQDHVGYLPWLLKELYPDEIDFTIGNFYHAGRTLRDYVDDFIVDENPETGLYSHATNTKTWTQEANKTLLYAITQENWDYISIQAYTPSNTVADEAAAALEFVPWLRAKCPSSFELCYLMHQSFGTSTAQQNVRDVANLITVQNPVTVLFAPYFCIKEAQKYWTTDGVLTPTGDGTHLKEGIAVMITGMHLMQVICTKLGLTNKVLKNGLMMTAAIWNTLNVPGPNPPASPQPDDSYATDYNYQYVQICSIQGTKEAQAFYNNSINTQLSSLLS